MFVAEIHQGRRPYGNLGHGQTAVIQCLARVQEEDGVHDVAEYLSTDCIDGPLGQRKPAEALLASLDDALAIRASEMVREQFRRGKVLIGELHETAEPDRQPFSLSFIAAYSSGWPSMGRSRWRS